MASNRPRFGVQDLPSAYFCDNVKSNALRNELIKNQVRISECEQGDLENVFFSDENISLINKQLILSVFKKTNGKIKISDQSKENLIIVMRYVFLEHSRHLPFDIAGQIKELNCRVVGEILPNIITNANQRIDYLEEINNPRKMLPLPINVHKSNRNLQSTSSIIFGK
jgi:hypothetical protein